MLMSPATITTMVRRVVLALAVVCLWVPATNGFQVPVLPQHKHTQTTVGPLQAWTLLPSDASAFVIKSPWYNEYNPTARTTVYAE